ncbi:MAG: hypothetical protein V5A88_05830 [Candidatus Thermoplasmatota archaeon]
MKPLIRSEEGQSSLLDAMIFFAILMIGSLILAFVPFPSGSPETQEGMRLYGESTLDSYLHSTLNRTSYEHEDEMIHLDDRKISELVVEDLYLRDNTDVDNESLREGIERPLNETLNDLVFPQYNYNFTAWSSGGADLGYGQEVEGVDEIISASQELHTPDKNETYTANLKIWLA